MASFNDLGLREPLLMALEEEGIEHPTALQAAAVPVLRREGNLVARASSGSGKTLAYALGVFDRIEPRAASDGDEGEGDDESPATRVLILVATAEAAEWTALALVPLAHAAELAVTATGPGWGTEAGDADVLVATPQQVMDAVRSSGVKLEGVEAVVVDGASDIEALGGMESLESIFDNVPRTTQRVVVTGAMTPAVQDLVDRRVKRAIRYPVQAAVPDESPEANETTGVVGYVPVGEREKVDTVARLLGGGDGEAPPVLVCRTDERAAQVAEALSLRGFLVSDAGDDGDADVVVVGSTEALAEMGEGGPSGTVISFDVPADEESLKRRHGGERTGFVLVQPRELQHLHEVARRARLDARPAGVTGEQHGADDELRRFRSELRRAIREEDIGAQMLVLEPLFEDFTAAEVAAAAAALLRKRPPAAPEPGAASTPRGSTGRAPARESTAGAAPAAFARLFVGVGERDGVRAGDLMGAIAGEADIPGSSVGKIEIRDTFSIVEVPADAAQKVIDRVNGTTIKGRSVRVDYDRGADRARRPGPGPGGGGARGGFGGPKRGGGFGGGGPRGGGRPGPGGGTRRPPVRRPPRDD
ncbi:MAG: DbpA RNA binding domain-containing protein [Longimicrobiaceae bacterium]